MLRFVFAVACLLLFLWALTGFAVAQQQSYGGMTCVDVRKLSAVERKYMIWRLGLSPAQVAAIKKACGIK